MSRRTIIACDGCDKDLLPGFEQVYHVQIDQTHLDVCLSCFGTKCLRDIHKRAPATGVDPRGRGPKPSPKPKLLPQGDSDE